MTCPNCKRDRGLLFRGRCTICCPNLLLACPKCPSGMLVNKPTPQKMNRRECNTCGRETNR